jgi:hypothetical protein
MVPDLATVGINNSTVDAATITTIARIRNLQLGDRTRAHGHAGQPTEGQRPNREDRCRTRAAHDQRQSGVTETTPG